MKNHKLAMASLTLLMAVLMAFGALAEAAPKMTLEKAYEVADGKLLGATDLVAFRTERSGPLGIMAPDGSVVVPNEYLHLELRNAYGYIEAAKEQGMNTLGLIDTQGNVLVPLQYGVIDILSKEWVAAITLAEATEEEKDYKSLFGGSNYYRIVDRTFYYMPTATKAGSLPRNVFDKATGYPDFLIVKDMDGVNTVYDEAFNNIGTAEETYKGYLFEKNGEQWDVKRAGDGKLLFTTPYEVGDFVRDDNTFIIRHENKQGRLDLAGNVVIPPEYDRLTTSASDYMRAKLKGDEKEGLISVATGQAVTPFAYDEVINTYPRGISTPSIAMTLVDGFAAVLVDGKIGFINDKGEQTVAPTYAKDAVKQVGNTLLYSDISGNKVLVAADGTVTEHTWKEMSVLYNANNGRFYTAKNDEGQVAVIDWHGQELLPFGNYSEYDLSTSNGGSLLLAKNKDTGMVDVYRINK